MNDLMDNLFSSSPVMRMPMGQDLSLRQQAQSLSAQIQLQQQQSSMQMSSIQQLQSQIPFSMAPSKPLNNSYKKSKPLSLGMSYPPLRNQSFSIGPCKGLSSDDDFASLASPKFAMPKPQKQSKKGSGLWDLLGSAPSGGDSFGLLQPKSP